jgi:hypothetical protein
MIDQMLLGAVVRQTTLHPHIFIIVGAARRDQSKKANHRWHIFQTQ